MRTMTKAELQGELNAAATDLMKAWKNRHEVSASGQARRARIERRKADGQRFVYVIGAEGQPVKIGVAADVKKRRKALQTGCPHQLRIYHKAVCPPGLELQIEAACHRALGAQRLKGEWFKVSPEAAKATITAILAQ